ncbi:MAG: dipeptidase, partial [Chloroflexi bacterium]|nr:dipeptidase [Chloroflexota bacterium]
STTPEHAADMARAAEWLADYMRDMGLEHVQIIPTAGHPVVYASYTTQRPNAPTLLVYGHYDVQPEDPRELWHSDPFEPTVRGEYLYARGATDMKGQIMAVLAAVQAALQTGELPVNVKFMIEGEEEIGSPSLAAVIREHRDLFAADVSLNPDAGMLAPDKPTITYALRGLAYFELWVYGPKQDLHSGLFGGVVHNPAQALAELLAGMHDASGRVTLPGFYDAVRPLDEEERAELARLPQDEQFFLEHTGVPALWGEPEYTPVERVTARPTLEINGLLSGFTGEGAKTVIPSKAMAKISMRLVPDQRPEEVHRQLLRYLEDHAPNTIRWEVKAMHGAPPAMTDRRSPWVQALARALEATWHTRPLFKREGGTIPVVALLKEILGMDSVLTGFALPDDNMHAPNERLHLPTWYKGIEALVRYWQEVGGK